MAIKRINDILPGVRRPFRLSDLQEVWRGLDDALAAGTTNAPRILSGFKVNSDNTFTAGVVAINEKLYYHEDGTVAVGDNMYAHEVSFGELRIFADGTTQVFDFDRVVNSSPTGGALIGRATLGNVDGWKTPFIGPGMIRGWHLADEEISRDKLADEVVTWDKLSYDLQERVKYREFSMSLAPVLNFASNPVKEATENLTWTPAITMYELGQHYYWQLNAPGAIALKVVPSSVQATFAPDSWNNIGAVYPNASAVATYRAGTLFVVARKMDSVSITPNDRVNIRLLIEN